MSSEKQDSKKYDRPGQPTKYNENYTEQAYKLCLLGATDQDLADFFEVCVATIHNWKHDQPKFLDAIKRGKHIADTNVAQSLYKRATGFTCKDTKFATHEGVITDSKEFEKNYPPDTVAAIFWLKNRQSGKWSDKTIQSHEVTKETASLLGMIDGSSKGKLPAREEDQDAG
jgi:hypothetical protein